MRVIWMSVITQFSGDFQSNNKKSRLELSLPFFIKTVNINLNFLAYLIASFQDKGLK